MLVSSYQASGGWWTIENCLHTTKLLVNSTSAQGIKTKTHLLLRVHIFPARARGRAPGMSRSHTQGQPCAIPGLGARKRVLLSTARSGQAELLLSQANQLKFWPSLFELVRTQVGLTNCLCLLCRPRERTEKLHWGSPPNSHWFILPTGLGQLCAQP